MDDEQTSVSTIPVYVFTEFFNREAQMYALGDIPLRKPKSIKAMIYTIVLLLIYSVPMLFIVGIGTVLTGPIPAAIVFGPPLVAGPFVSKPNFHNKTFMKHMTAIAKWMGLADMYCDMREMQYAESSSADIGLWLANDSDIHHA